MYFYHKPFLTAVCLVGLCGCTTLQVGFLGFGPRGDKKEYAEARDLFNDGRYGEAQTKLQDYIYKTKNVKRREARAYRLLGQSYENLGRLDKALETYQEALEFHPENVPLLLSAADLYKRTNLNEQSAALYNRALRAEPDNLQALAGMAENYIRMGFYSKARMYYEQYFKLDPSAHSQNRARYAYTFLQQRDYPNAFINITMALSENDHNPDFWFLSARANRGLGHYYEAMEDLDIALFLAPARRDLLGTKALWLYQEERFEESLAVASAILDKYPGNDLGLFIRYLNLNAQGRTKEAQNALSYIKDADGNQFIYRVAQTLQKDSSVK